MTYLLSAKSLSSLHMNRELTVFVLLFWRFFNLRPGELAYAKIVFSVMSYRQQLPSHDHSHITNSFISHNFPD
jgi:hypothetical protein